jgi:hypothetical protein
VPSPAPGWQSSLSESAGPMPCSRQAAVAARGPAQSRWPGWSVDLAGPMLPMTIAALGEGDFPCGSPAFSLSPWPRLRC